MKRSLFANFAAACLLAASTMFAAVHDVLAKAVGYARDLYSFSVKVVFTVFAGPAPVAIKQDIATERLLRATKSFLQRIEQRSRPIVTPGWRMCPSA